MKLSARLQAVYELITPNSTFADIGTDHGYLPVAACLNGIVHTAIASDIAKGPLEAAKLHVREAALSDTISCRLGPGLQEIQPGEVNGVVICGMGGPMIRQILQESPAVIPTLAYMILQPMSGSASVRRYIYEHNWHIDDERLIIEDGHLYEIFRAIPGEREGLPDWLYAIGPVNWEKQDPLVGMLLENLIKRYTLIREGLQRSKLRVSTNKVTSISVKIKKLEELAWLYNCRKSST